jgi:hypothetical protein
MRVVVGMVGNTCQLTVGDCRASSPPPVNNVLLYSSPYKGFLHHTTKAA